MNNALLDFVSQTLLQYMEQNDLRFTDFEKASLIYHSHLLPEEKHNRFEALAAETADACLKTQIEHRLQIEREDIIAFKNNAEGCVYVVNSYEYDDRDPYPCGYFAYFEPAYEHGKKQGCKFDIEKYRIVGLNGMQPLKGKGYFNPNIRSHTDIEELVEEQDCDDFHCSDGCFKYDKDGTLTYFHCANDLRDDKEVMSLLYDLNRFENAFIFMPDPFELGDIVKETESGKVGIVETSREERDRFHERIKSGDLTGCEFLDACITVEFLRENGTFSHDHVNPAFLEKYEPKKGDDDYEILIAGSELFRGTVSLDWFTYVYDDYRNQKRTK